MVGTKIRKLDTKQLELRLPQHANDIYNKALAWSNKTYLTLQRICVERKGTLKKEIEGKNYCFVSQFMGQKCPYQTSSNGSEKSKFYCNYKI
ncbi:hypothetical protein ACFLZZ_01725 [Nanoarchaeota archaeon]